MNLPWTSLLVDGPEVGESRDKCYLGIFKSEEIDQDIWYFGNQAMEEYYAVFDLSPADERGKDYIQFGIAHKVETHMFEY